MPQHALPDLTAQLLDAARRAGADAADAMAIDATSVSVDVRAGALEQAERSESIDVGLRVFIGQRQSTVSASDIRPDTIEEMASRAVTMAREAPEDPHIGLADPAQLSQLRDAAGLELTDPAPEPDPAALEEAARTTETAAMAMDGVTQVQGASAGYGRRTIHLAASNGFEGGYGRTENGLSCVAISGTGTEMERDYDGDHRVFAGDLRDPAEIGTTAGTRAAERAGARKPKTGTYPVLFDERISSSLIGHLLQAANGNAIARGSSWLLGREGQQLLPDHLDLTEDPLRRRMPSSRPFDAEGLPTAARKIIDKGTLTGWTLDLATARKLGLQSTASAARGPSSVPAPSVTNVALTQGDKSRKDLMRDMGTGLLVTSMIGSTINPNTGDYSRGASGFWIENGEIAYPVNECTIAGSLPEMLARIVPANDARTWLSRVVPSLLIDSLTLAGD
ncbi:TldD/PmbA family protein [Aestuariibius insulae]|uniref:TldD/PmbA family protein n=1 Tax=Aestuariibius insulae TaxID=2058287 RepID=UPI00345EC157